MNKCPVLEVIHWRQQVQCRHNICCMSLPVKVKTYNESVLHKSIEMKTLAVHQILVQIALQLVDAVLFI